MDNSQYAEMSYKQYVANPARRMTRFDEATYIRNENKYDEMIRYLYECECHQKAMEQHKQNKSKEELRKTIKAAHPDKRDGKEDKRKEFEDALEELRKLEQRN